MMAEQPGSRPGLKEIFPKNQGSNIPRKNVPNQGTIILLAGALHVHRIPYSGPLVAMRGDSTGVLVVNRTESVTRKKRFENNSAERLKLSAA